MGASLLSSRSHTQETRVLGSSMKLRMRFGPSSYSLPRQCRLDASFPLCPLGQGYATIRALSAAFSEILVGNGRGDRQSVMQSILGGFESVPAPAAPLTELDPGGRVHSAPSRIRAVRPTLPHLAVPPRSYSCSMFIGQPRLQVFLKRNAAATGRECRPPQLARPLKPGIGIGSIHAGCDQS